jgi:hypothetical protein
MASSTPKTELSLALVEAETAAEICEKCQLAAETMALLEEGMTPQAFLGTLIDAGIHDDSIKFLAQALPKREAVAWAEACAREAAGERPPDLDAQCLAAVAYWLKDPTEENRRAAMDLADDGGYSTPAATAAAAAGWTGGSMGPAEYDDVLPPENLAGTMVSSTVLLASYAGAPEDAKDTEKAFLEKGIEIASRGVDVA